MKRTVFTLTLTAMLMTTLALTTAANWSHRQTLHPNGGPVRGIVFEDN